VARERSLLRNKASTTYKNQKRQEKQFLPGQIVLHRQLQVSTGGSGSLKPFFTGPYIVDYIDKDKSSCEIEHLHTGRRLSAHFTNLQIFNFDPKSARLPHDIDDQIENLFPEKYSIAHYHPQSINKRRRLNAARQLEEIDSEEQTQLPEPITPETHDISTDGQNPRQEEIHHSPIEHRNNSEKSHSSDLIDWSDNDSLQPDAYDNTTSEQNSNPDLIEWTNDDSFHQNINDDIDELTPEQNNTDELEENFPDFNTQQPIDEFHNESTDFQEPQNSTSLSEQLPERHYNLRRSKPNPFTHTGRIQERT
jgi:hypothetical protein